MAAKNGCSEAARLLLAHGAFFEAKANVCFLEWNDIITPDSLVLNQWKIAQLLRHCWSIMLTAVQRTILQKQREEFFLWMKHTSLYHRRKRKRRTMGLKPWKKVCLLWTVENSVICAGAKMNL